MWSKPDVTRCGAPVSSAGAEVAGAADASYRNRRATRFIADCPKRSGGVVFHHLRALVSICRVNIHKVSRSLARRGSGVGLERQVERSAVTQAVIVNWLLSATGQPSAAAYSVMFCVGVALCAVMLIEPNEAAAG